MARTTRKITAMGITWEADHEQYWQGHGLSFSKHTYSATGCGDTLGEAFDDALEQLAQNDVRLSDAQEKELLDELDADSRGIMPLSGRNLETTVVEAYCDESGNHIQEELNHSEDCPEDCESEDCAVADDPDCAVCAGKCHFYVSIDVTVEDKAE